MAVSDFRQYLGTVQRQYLEMKEDLRDFETALKDGFITEEKLQDAIEDVNKIETNYNRLLYVAYLLELPNRKEKKVKHRRAHKKVEQYLVDEMADEASVIYENASALDTLRAKLKELKK